MYYFRAAFKKLAFNSSAVMCYVMKTENIKLFKVFHPTPKHTVKSHPCLSNEYLHKHAIIMIYYCFNCKFESNPTE